jgi:hypothetical protein
MESVPGKIIDGYPFQYDSSPLRQNVSTMGRQRVPYTLSAGQILCHEGLVQEAQVVRESSCNEASLWVFFAWSNVIRVGVVEQEPSAVVPLAGIWAGGRLGTSIPTENTTKAA